MTLAPLLVDASVDGDQVTLNYDEPLDSTSTPDAASFTVTVTGDSSPSVVTDVEVSGMTVTLTLDGPVEAGAVVSVSYQPSGSPIRDTADNESAAFTDHPVENEDVGEQYEERPSVRRAADEAARVGKHAGKRARRPSRCVGQ